MLSTAAAAAGEGRGDDWRTAAAVLVARSRSRLPRKFGRRGAVFAAPRRRHGNALRTVGADRVHSSVAATTPGKRARDFPPPAAAIKTSSTAATFDFPRVSRDVLKRFRIGNPFRTIPRYRKSPED